MDRGQTRAAAFTFDEMCDVSQAFRFGGALIDRDAARVRFVNDGVATVRGRAADDVVGKRLGELVEPAQAGAADAAVDLVVHGGVQTTKVLLRLDSSAGP